MLKKTLLITSALATAGLISSAAVAEMKISGKMEYAYSSVTEEVSNVKTQGGDGKIIGQENNIKVSTSGELDSGIAYYGNFNVEDGVEASSEMGFKMDGASLRFGSDTSGGTEKIKQITPMVNNRRADVYAGKRGNANDCYAGCDVEDVTSGENYIGVGYKHDLITLDYAYTPNLGQANTTDTDKGSGVAGGASGSSFSLKGSLGVEGLTVAYGKNTEKTLTAGAEDAEASMYGAAYKYGQFAVGYQHNKNESGGVAAASVEESETTDYSITYSVNDNLSVGFLDSSTDYKATPTTAAVAIDAKVYQVGYSLGAVSLHATYAEADNAFATKNRDFSVYKLKAKMAF